MFVHSCQRLNELALNSYIPLILSSPMQLSRRTAPACLHIACERSLDPGLQASAKHQSAGRFGRRHGSRSGSCQEAAGKARSQLALLVMFWRARGVRVTAALGVLALAAALGALLITRVVRVMPASTCALVNGAEIAMLIAGEREAFESLPRLESLLLRLRLERFSLPESSE